MRYRVDAHAMWKDALKVHYHRQEHSGWRIVEVNYTQFGSAHDQQKREELISKHVVHATETEITRIKSRART